MIALLPTPSFAEAFTLDLEFLPPIDIAELATGGIRRELALAGGRVQGDLLSGSVVAAQGGHSLLVRRDGKYRVEARYVVQAASGEFVRLAGHGYGERDTAATLVLQADVSEPGTFEHLGRRVFLATSSAQEPHCFQVWEIR